MFVWQDVIPHKNRILYTYVNICILYFILYIIYACWKIAYILSHVVKL